MLTVVNADGSTRDGSLLDEIVREGERRMLAAALEAEVNTCIDQARWRAVNGAHLAPLVRAGARFERGRLVERSEQVAA